MLHQFDLLPCCRDLWLSGDRASTLLLVSALPRNLLIFSNHRNLVNTSSNRVESEIKLIWWSKLSIDSDFSADWTSSSMTKLTHRHNRELDRSNSLLSPPDYTMWYTSLAVLIHLNDRILNVSELINKFYSKLVCKHDPTRLILTCVASSAYSFSPFMQAARRTLSDRRGEREKRAQSYVKMFEAIFMKLFLISFSMLHRAERECAHHTTICTLSCQCSRECIISQCLFIIYTTICR